MILIAEDDPQDIELMTASLEELELPHEIVFVRDGAEALEFLNRTDGYTNRPPKNPALVLLDIKMPRVNGVDVLRHMKTSNELRSIPVVMLTSSRQAADLRECYALGANAYVVKPMRFNDFVSAIKHLGTFWALINEPLPQDIAEFADN